VVILRKADPSRPRPFRTPLVPIVPALGVIVCAAMIIGLDRATQITALVWMVIGLIIYFAYSKDHSKLKA
jgi:APA family basic amino acid/polyamine antiporter